MIYTLCAGNVGMQLQAVSPPLLAWIPLSTLVKAQVRGDLPYKLCSDPQGSLSFLAMHNPLLPCLPFVCSLFWSIQLSPSRPREKGILHGTSTALFHGVTFHQAAHYSSVPGCEHFNDNLPCVQVRGRLDKSSVQIQITFQLVQKANWYIDPTFLLLEVCIIFPPMMLNDSHCS